MGKLLAEASAEARAIFEQADEVLGRSISKLCFEGTEEELRRTSNTQPAMFTASAAALAALLAAGFDGEFTAGHSLGEYTALYAAGSIDFATGLQLVQTRGQAMEEAGRNRPGVMAALLGLPEEKADEICREASSAGIVAAANFNSPTQPVISGEEAAVDRAIELAKAAGCKKAMKLNVGGAFHSPLMSEAAERLATALQSAAISPPQMVFINNVAAETLTDPESIRRSLLTQLTSCVKWTDCVRKIAALGATHLVEVGPGNVLTGQLKRINPELRGRTFFNLRDLEELQTWLTAVV
jgi:[acyl-carrier-protein] S-malonyltransferase